MSFKSAASTQSRPGTMSGDVKVHVTNKKFLMNRLCYNFFVKLVFNTINLIESTNKVRIK